MTPPTPPASTDDARVDEFHWTVKRPLEIAPEDATTEQLADAIRLCRERVTRAEDRGGFGFFDAAQYRDRADYLQTVLDARRAS